MRSKSECRETARFRRLAGCREAGTLVGKLIGTGVAFAQDMGERDAPGEPFAEGRRFDLERSQVRGIDLIAPFHLPGHELTIGVDRHPRRAPRPRFFKAANERFVLGDIVGRLPNALTNLGNHCPIGIGQKHADPRRAGVAFGGAVNKKYKFH